MKFNTAVSATTQQQGIVVEESANKLLRFETYYEGDSPKLFVAAIARAARRSCTERSSRPARRST